MGSNPTLSATSLKAARLDGDNSRLRVHQRLYNLTRIVNTAGNRITSMFGDGSEGQPRMNDDEVLAYLLSHAPIERFYIFVPPGGDPLLKYFDSAGRSWNIMEDDPRAVACAAALLKRSGVKVFEDYSELLDYEQAGSRTR